MPKTELETAHLKLDVAEQKSKDLVATNARQVNKVIDLQRKLHRQMEAEEKVAVLMEQRDDCEEEMEVLKRRLEAFDPVFRFESQVFNKIATVINRANMSLKQAFDTLDTGRKNNGVLTPATLKSSLEKLSV